MFASPALGIRASVHVPCIRQQMFRNIFSLPVFYFYQIMTYFNSLNIMSLNCDAKKEEEKGKKSTISK